jgi:hypothetical protein
VEHVKNVKNITLLFLYYFSTNANYCIALLLLFLIILFLNPLCCAPSSNDSARASDLAALHPIRRQLIFSQVIVINQSIHFYSILNFIRKKMGVIRMILILTTIWSTKTARSNPYDYEDNDYLSREAWLDEVDANITEQDHLQTRDMLRAMFQLTERKNEILVSERLFKTFCDRCMWLVLYNGEKSRKKIFGRGWKKTKQCGKGFGCKASNVLSWIGGQCVWTLGRAVLG